MLVLKRKVGEGIRIEDDVRFQILDVHQWQDGILKRVDPATLQALEISVGIAAPKEKRILRDEVWNANQIKKAGEK